MKSFMPILILILVKKKIERVSVNRVFNPDIQRRDNPRKFGFFYELNFQVDCLFTFVPLISRQILRMFVYCGALKNVQDIPFSVCIDERGIGFCKIFVNSYVLSPVKSSAIICTMV